MRFEEEVLRRIENDPGISTRTLSSQLAVSARTIGRVIQDDQLYPYHYQRVQSLYPGDSQKRLEFCHWFLQQCQSQRFVMTFCCTDEAQFTRDGLFNFHNSHVYAHENPHAVKPCNHQRRFSLNVWAGIVGNKLLGPHFFEGSLNGHMYTQFLDNEFSEMLADLPVRTRAGMWFMHDGAPPHFSREARSKLDEMFPNKWVGRNGPIQWPPRSPDLNSLDFFLWGYLKDKVYSVEVNDVETLRRRIIETCDQIRNDENMLENVSRSMEHRANMCIAQHGSNLSLN